MSIALVDFAFSFCIALLSVSTVWFWRRASSIRETPDSDGKPQIDQARDVLASLNALAAGVAADVGEHNIKVEEINQQLSAEGGSETAVVVNAVGKLLQANHRMQEQLDSAEEQLRQQAEEIESQTTAARTDALTGLANRRVFDDELAAMTERFEQDGTPFSISILDIDHFKKFNDAHGHQVGDRVLQHVAAVFLDAVGPSDVVTRFGGEEFAVIHPDTTVEEAARLADNLRQALDTSRIHEEGKQLHVTASLGVAESILSEAVSDLILRADQALYSAKDAGRNCTFWHDGVAACQLADEQPVRETTVPNPTDTQPTTPRMGSAERTAELQRRLLDRHRFLTQTAEALQDCQQTGVTPAVFLVQVDHFDDLADRHGGDTGERILDAVATVLLAIAKQGGSVARFGAHTFAVLISGYDAVQAVQVAEHVRKLSRQCPLPTATGRLQFTLSVAATGMLAGDEATRLIGRAETALDSALRAGGDCTFFHNGQWSETAAAVLHDAAVAT
jgi:diguanylate cyclase